MPQFELDNKEATVSILFIYIVTLSVECTLKGYNTKIKAMCEIMSKGSKEALTVSIVTYITHVDRVKSNSINSIRTVLLLCRRCWKKLKMVLHICDYNFLNIQWIFNPKKVLESWESGLSNHTTKCYICRKGQKLFWLLILSTCFDIYSMVLHICVYSFLNIQRIFNPIKVLESWDLALFNYTIKCYIYWSMSILLTYITFGGMVGKPDSQLSKSFFGLKIHWILKKL